MPLQQRRIAKGHPHYIYSKTGALATVFEHAIPIRCYCGQNAHLFLCRFSPIAYIPVQRRSEERRVGKQQRRRAEGHPHYNNSKTGALLRFSSTLSLSDAIAAKMPTSFYAGSPS